MSNEKIEQYLKRHHCHDYFNAYGDLVQDDHYFLYREEIDELIKLIKNAEREACAKLCEEKQTYSMPIPCPDGISGCCVAHFVPARREKTGTECAAAIRARGDNSNDFVLRSVE